MGEVMVVESGGKRVKERLKLREELPTRDTRIAGDVGKEEGKNKTKKWYRKRRVVEKKEKG